MFKYEPANLTIQVGDEVNWNNIGGTHDVNFDIDSQTNESFGNPDNTSLATNSGGDLGSLTFSIPGTYTYDCSIGSHAANGMVGTITVLGDDNASFTEAFGGSVIDGNSLTFPTGAEPWAGFANMNTALYPITFVDGGSVSFDASSDTPAEIYFKFEFNPHPNVTPLYQTSNISIDGSGSYTIEIPSQGENTFSSFLVYVVTPDVAVNLTNVFVTPTGSVVADVYGCMDANASNYNTDATLAGSDEYGNSTCIYASCDDIPEYGCIYGNGFGAFNADFTAAQCSEYGGSPCEEPVVGTPGCMDENATNYNADATSPSSDQYGNSTCVYATCDDIPEYGCIYANAFGAFNADFTAAQCTEYGGTPCEEPVVGTPGCMDANASNYDANATVDGFDQYGNSTCVYATCDDVPVDGCIYVNGFGPFTADFTAAQCTEYNGTPCGDSPVSEDIAGCMDMNATNYDAAATIAGEDEYGNSTCIYASCDDIPEYGCIYADGFGAFNDEFNAAQCSGYGGTPCSEPTDDIAGCMDMNATNYDANATVAGEDQYGNSTCIYASCDDIPTWGCIYVDGFGTFNPEFGDDLCVTYGGTPCVEPTDEIEGCMDENATNYNATATVSDYDQYGNLKCVYASCDDIPEYGCIYADGFGAFNAEFGAEACSSYGGTPCSEPTDALLGCMDANASNYDATATEQSFDQYGNLNCLFESCDAIPQPGCIYPNGFGLFNAEFGPEECTTYGGNPCGEYQSVRYQDEIFTEVTVTENVQYGANIGIITQAPVLENLMMDVYEPTGDTETDRRVIVMLHTGSFLPAIANGQPTGDKSDFAIVEACKNYARRGYVAVAVNYRLGWNPVSTSEDVRRSTLIQAAYRGLQDTKTAVRFLRKSATEDGNPYGVGEKFAVGGYGTGGYLSLAMATLNDYDSELLMPKFIDSSQETIDEFGQPMPYIIPSVLGNFEATDNAMICVANHVGYSSEVDMVFNAGGALPDISWLDAGEVPIASMQNILDPDAPYAEGNVIVPTTGEFVIVAHGSQIVQETANAYGNNDVFDGMSTTLNDAWYGNGNGAENAAAAGHDDLPGLFGMVTPAPSAAPTVCGMQTVQNAPWDAWNNAMYDAMASVYQGQPAGVMGCLATLGNPDMSEEKALAMLDMMDEFFAPRIDAALSTPSSDVDNEGPTSQTIELPNGWSMFSTYMTASDMAFDAVVSSIVDNVTIAKDFNGSAYLPEYSFNGIGNMELGQGYQIKTDEAVTLTVGGSYNAPEANPIALVQGWNMIGYLRLQPADASLVLADLTAQSIIEIAKDYNGSAFLPEYSFNGIGDFEAGRGYQVKTTEAATLTLNANGSDYNRTVALKTTFNKTNHFEQAVNTGSNMTITILNDAWEVSPTIGDEIAAYNANGILVGSAKYTSPVTVLTVWGNDATTNTVDGLVNAEGMRFKVWNKRYNSTDELVVTNWIEGSNAYEVNAVNQIGQIGYVSNSVNSSTFGLYPVPANKELNLDLTLDLSQDVTVTLYNLIGKVMNVATYSLEKGLNTVLLDVETLKDGTYLCKVLTNNGEITRKFNVIK